MGTSCKLSGITDLIQAAVGAGYFGGAASSTEDAEPKPGERSTHYLYILRPSRAGVKVLAVVC